MKKIKRNSNQQTSSFYASWATYTDIVQGANKLVPGFVVVIMILAAVTIGVSLLSVTVMVGVIILLVLITAVIVYAGTQHYGEAALALVAGLLAAFTVDWTVGRFIAFTVVWVAFSSLALMIAGIKLAAKVESIYTHAAGSLSNDPAEIGRIREQLLEIGRKGTPLHQILPVERAEAIRLLVFRKVPVGALADSLASVEIISTISRVDVKVATAFIADLFNSLQAQGNKSMQSTINTVLDIMRECSAPPDDFIRAFQLCRRLLLSHNVVPDRFFQAISDCLEEGVAPENFYTMVIIKSG